MSEKLWFLKKCELFRYLSAEELHQLEKQSRSRTFPKKSPIYLPADKAETVYLLAKGLAKISHLTPEGKESILAFIEPGELFGELAIVEGGPREEYAEAIEETTVVMLPGEAIQRLMHELPELSFGMTKMIGLRRRRIERRLKNLLFLSSRERLVHLLLELAEQYGKPTEAGIQLGIKLSHQDLASVIGSTRETVTVVLGEMQAEKLLLVGRRSLTLLDYSRLASSVQENITQTGSESLHPSTTPSS